MSRLSGHPWGQYLSVCGLPSNRRQWGLGIRQHRGHHPCPPQALCRKVTLSKHRTGTWARPCPTTVWPGAHRVGSEGSGPAGDKSKERLRSTDPASPHHRVTPCSCRSVRWPDALGRAGPAGRTVPQQQSGLRFQGGPGGCGRAGGLSTGAGRAGAVSAEAEGACASPR